jgi:hypothetical protein
LKEENEVSDLGINQNKTFSWSDFGLEYSISCIKRVVLDGTEVKIGETYCVHLFAINGCCTQQVTEASQSRKFEDDQILMKNLGSK